MHKCSRYKDSNCNDLTHNSITLSNKSNENICFHFYWNYPDTNIGEYNPIYGGPRAITYPNDSFITAAGPMNCCCWESNFRNNRKEWVYIFNSDSLKSIPWDLVRKTNRGLIERRLIDLEYLKQNNFKILYQ